MDGLRDGLGDGAVGTARVDLHRTDADLADLPAGQALPARQGLAHQAADTPCASLEAGRQLQLELAYFSRH